MRIALALKKRFCLKLFGYIFIISVVLILNYLKNHFKSLHMGAEQQCF